MDVHFSKIAPEFSYLSNDLNYECKRSPFYISNLILDGGFIS